LQAAKSKKPAVLELPNIMPGVFSPFGVILNCGQEISSVDDLEFLAIAVHRRIICLLRFHSNSDPVQVVFWVGKSKFRFPKTQGISAVWAAPKRAKAD
jgi:hypothetical protein